MDASYDSVSVFLADLYDPASGGFYESPFKEGARIESTAPGITMLSKGNILNDLPNEVRESFITFFQWHQDQSTGFFEDLQEQRGHDERRGRALSYSVNALKDLGASPMYPLPGNKFDYSRMAYLQSIPAFEAWLDSLPWRHSWSGGSILSAQSTLIRQLPEPLQGNIIDFLFAYLPRHQHPSTGLWGGEIPYVQVSGTFKVSMVYKAFERAMPRADHIYKSLLACIRTEVCQDATWVRNPLHLLQVNQPQLETFSDAERQEIIRLAMHNMSQFLRPDGGFARNLDRRYRVTDGCSQAMKTLNAVRVFAGLEEKSFPKGDQFLSEIK